LPQGSARLWLEGYGPDQAVVLVECATGDPARTRAEVRSLFRAHGGHLGAPGSVAYLFQEVGVIAYPAGTDRERLAQLAYAAGAEDVVLGSGGERDGLEVLTAPADLVSVRVRIAARGGGAGIDAQVTWRTHRTVRLEAGEARELLRLLTLLACRDDVRSVYSNAEIPDQIVAEP
jgi:transcriptional/translational regulatory protein YebC/TACO1